jgi:Na+/proline symporter
VAALTFAHFGEATQQTTIVLINAVGSLLYGPILAAFILGLVTKGVTARAVNIGIGVGILINIYLWLFTPISWLWWNLIGFVVVVIIAFILSAQNIAREGAFVTSRELYTGREIAGINWPAIYKMVGIYFFLIILLCYLIQKTL